MNFDIRKSRGLNDIKGIVFMDGIIDKPKLPLRENSQSKIDNYKSNTESKRMQLLKFDKTREIKE